MGKTVTDAMKQDIVMRTVFIITTITKAGMGKCESTLLALRLAARIESLVSEGIIDSITPENLYKELEFICIKYELGS